MVANRDLVARVRPDIIQAIDRDFIEPLQNFLEKAQARGDIGATDSWAAARALTRSEEHTSELQSLMRISYAVFCLKTKKDKSSRDISNMQYNIHNTAITVDVHTK